jgi:hypothetical protein
MVDGVCFRGTRRDVFFLDLYWKPYEDEGAVCWYEYDVLSGGRSRVSSVCTVLRNFFRNSLSLRFVLRPSCDGHAFECE